MTTFTPVADGQAPIQDFSQCHAGIVKRLHLLGELPALLAPAERASQIAERSVSFFREAIFEHHLDEERELFPVVLSHAQAGAEHDQVKALIKRLTDEHRQLEALWKRVETGLKKVVKGRFDELNSDEVQRLVTQYLAHAEFEENEFLPLSSTILGRNANHMAALGLSLHMRHSHEPVSTYL
ncbi:MAG: hemerythrin domain-containing protein [Rhodoferax sp.]|uniref:hemerythrin domain-containing protein n=1 Tax=Rhodoferax sp. TaxID=50421 RepID=UPI001B59FE92|nr:hemerythrin domain-containing protein [Rhodoferax sp.]MBP8286644.1 hemerythrin domain-containing protein [Rhodoferax sp.]MBP9149827.1 hemerythrin domain-containing protein [Rhodoferax sp.]MBP9737008.1 hemerythrin domain-containing protein [Rhodoferax sp.]